MAEINNTSNSVTLDETQGTGKPRDSKEGYFWCSIFIIEAFVIIILNILTIIGFVKKPCLRKRSTYLLINLSMADMGIGAIVIPASIFRRGNTYGLWNVEITDAWFISTYAVDTFFFGCSLVFLVSISIERLHATRHPMRHRMISGSSYKRWIFVVWTASVFYASTTVFSLHFSPLGLNVWYIVAGCVLVCLLTLSCCYMAIFATVRCTQRPELTNRHARTEQKLTVTLFIVTLVSISSWLPYVLFTFLEPKLVHLLSAEALLRLRNVCEILFFANSFVNPLLYTIRMPGFRKAISSLKVIPVSCRLRCCTKNRVLSSDRKKKYYLNSAVMVATEISGSVIYLESLNNSDNGGDTTGVTL